MLNAVKIQREEIESDSKSNLTGSFFRNNESKKTATNCLETDFDDGDAKALLNHENVRNMSYKLQRHESATNTVMQNMQEIPTLDDTFQISE